jgi:hypothetical protein
MDRAALQDIELEYELRGTGEPVVLVHHGVGVDWFRLLPASALLATRPRRERPARRGGVAKARARFRRASTSSVQVSALAKCQSAMRRCMLKVVSMSDCHGLPRSISCLAIPKASYTARA